MNSGVRQCGGTAQTKFHAAHIPYEVVAEARKYRNAHQFHLATGISYKTAWYIFQRLKREGREDGNRFHFCECGCGFVTRNGWQFIKGHPTGPMGTK